ncbi:MAG: DoxX family protein [Pseudomonadota bacterium]
MENFQKLSYPLGRVLLGVLFLVAGLGKLAGGAEGLAFFIETQLPLGFLAWPVIIFEIAVGILLIIGYQTRWVALSAALFCVFTGVFYHLIPGMADPASMQMQITATLKNVALAGGYLLLFAKGAGGMCVDRT